MGSADQVQIHFVQATAPGAACTDALSAFVSALPRVQVAVVHRGVAAVDLYRHQNYRSSCHRVVQYHANKLSKCRTDRPNSTNFTSSVENSTNLDDQTPVHRAFLNGSISHVFVIIHTWDIRQVRRPGKPPLQHCRLPNHICFPFDASVQI